jgi:hypothetical protein
MNAPVQERDVDQTNGRDEGDRFGRVSPFQM